MINNIGLSVSLGNLSQWRHWLGPHDRAHPVADGTNGQVALKGDGLITDAITKIKTNNGDGEMYNLRKLRYDYDLFAPVISEDLLRLDRDKHHAAYVNGANTILQMMNKSVEDMADFSTRLTFRDFSFHIGEQPLKS